jgi:hypothetical protein
MTIDNVKFTPTGANARNILRLSKLVHMEIPDWVKVLSNDQLYVDPSYDDIYNQTMQYYTDYSCRGLFVYRTTHEHTLKKILIQTLKRKELSPILIVTTKASEEVWIKLVKEMGLEYGTYEDGKEIAFTRATTIPTIISTYRKLKIVDRCRSVIMDETVSKNMADYRVAEYLNYLLKEFFYSTLLVTFPELEKTHDVLHSLIEVDKKTWGLFLNLIRDQFIPFTKSRMLLMKASQPTSTHDKNYFIINENKQLYDLALIKRIFNVYGISLHLL